MPYIFVKHSVADYAKWKPGFDADEPNRRAHGFGDYAIYRDVDDPNVITIVGKLTDVAQGRAFASSDALREAMQKAGVVGPPEIWFAEEAESKRY